MRYCGNCGAQAESETMLFCSKCGGPLGTPAVKQPMKWYKFLIYFALYFSAFCTLVLGVTYITGGIYEVQSDGVINADAVYDTFGRSLQVVDVLYGALYILFSAFTVYTRFGLAKFKSSGPVCLYILYGADIVLTFLYNIALFAVAGINQIFTVSTLASIAITAGIILLNFAYFNKRKHLFVN